VRPWFNPNPNLSPRSGADRALGALVGTGLAVVGAAAVLAAACAWVFLMILVATAGAHGTVAVLVICALIAMAGFGLAVAAGGLWALLQIGSVRRALGLPTQHP
jgi:nitrate/nitrite transporter NarK